MNPAFIPLLFDGLMLDADHPRQDTAETIKTGVQRKRAVQQRYISSSFSDLGPCKVVCRSSTCCACVGANRRLR
jgi:hypothetical protein